MKVVVARTLPGGVPLFERDPLVSDLWIAPPGSGPSRAEMLDRVAGAHGAIVTVSERIDSAFFDAAGPQLIVVSNYAVGFDNMDVVKATKRGVWLTNTPDAVTPSTADMTWALLLGVSRRVHEGERDVRSGSFERSVGWDPCYLLGGDFQNQTLLIVGAGRIGYAVAMRSLGWNMRVLYVARSAKPEFEAAPFHGRRVSLAEGLAEADYVSIHTPLNDSTRHLIGQRELRMMKPSAFLVNTSRGAVIDEEALVRALRDGWIAGAGLDVFEHEPRVHPGLIEAPNTLLMPHVGSASRRQRPLMAEMAQRNVLAALRGEEPPNAVNRVGVSGPH